MRFKLYDKTGLPDLARVELTANETSRSLYEGFFNCLPMEQQDSFIRLLNPCEKAHPCDDLDVIYNTRLLLLSFFIHGLNSK